MTDHFDAEAVVGHVATKLQALAVRWGHPAWSDSWAEMVAREALTQAEEAAGPTLLQSEVNLEAAICCDCGAWPKPSCDRDGHGLVTLDDLIEYYHGAPSR